VVLSILLATLSKPSAVIFPGVIAVYEISKRKKEVITFFKCHWIFLISLLILSAIFTFILMKVMFEAGGIKHYKGIASQVTFWFAFMCSCKTLGFFFSRSITRQLILSW